MFLDVYCKRFFFHLELLVRLLSQSIIRLVPIKKLFEVYKGVKRQKADPQNISFPTPPLPFTWTARQRGNWAWYSPNIFQDGGQNGVNKAVSLILCSRYFWNWHNSFKEAVNVVLYIGVVSYRSKSLYKLKLYKFDTNELFRRRLSLHWNILSENLNSVFYNFDRFSL